MTDETIATTKRKSFRELRETNEKATVTKLHAAGEQLQEDLEGLSGKIVRAMSGQDAQVRAAQRARKHIREHTDVLIDRQQRTIKELQTLQRLNFVLVVLLAVATFAFSIAVL